MTDIRLVKVRLIGPPDAVQALGEQLAELDCSEMVDVSNAYPCRGSSTKVRVYADILITRHAGHHEGQEPRDRQLPDAEDTR